MQDFRNLKVWRAAHGLAQTTYESARAFPREETYGMRSQMRQAAVSISANIAEGCGRGSDRDFRRFLHNAMGSACELETLVQLAHDLGLMRPAAVQAVVRRLLPTKQMLAGLIRTLTADSG